MMCVFVSNLADKRYYEKRNDDISLRYQVSAVGIFYLSTPRK
jgi:hypothetical protein